MEQTKIVVGENGAETVPLTEADLKQQKEDQDNFHVAALAFLRIERNRRLAASDWTQSRDVTLSNDAEWKAYREALRRLPETETDFSNPTWPTEPSQ